MGGRKLDRHGKTREQVIHAFMVRRGGPWSVKALRSEFKLSLHTTSNTMRRLLVKGCVTAEGFTHTRVYRATGFAPDDMRGTAVGTQINLRKYSINPPLRAIRLGR